MQSSQGNSPSIEISHDVVARIREGDVAAFEQLFRATHSSLLIFATRYLREAARAEELVQEVYLDVWTKRAAWHVSGSVRGYLFAAVRNRALNVRRRDAVERDWIDSEGADPLGLFQAAPEVPGTQLEQAELHDRVQRALELLPERCQLVMHLRWRDGLSYAEIAEVMGISLKGVENQLGRGLRALRERLLGD